MEDTFVQPDWWKSAACRGMPSEMFFPSRGEDVKPAKLVCAECEVIHECLQWALDTKETSGIYGGKSERERRKLKRGQLRACVCLACGADIRSVRTRLYCDACRSLRRRARENMRMRTGVGHRRADD